MGNKLVTQLGQFPSAVLTGIDASGYPFSLRCKPQVDASRQVWHIPLSGAFPIRPGPAGLLVHSHNEELWNLKSIQILGRLEPAEQGWTFYPERFIPGGGFQGLIGQLRDLRKARSDANKYLQKRGLPRPEVHWDEFLEVIAEARDGK